MKFERSSGLLLHPTSLPGPYGVGDLGPQACRFVDFLSAAGCSLWQILPLGPTGYGDSPYQCFSAFAGNPNLVSPELLLQDGLLTPADLQSCPDFPPGRVDFGPLIAWKRDLLDAAFERLPASGLQAACAEFARRNAAWLEDYALFRAIKEQNGGVSWDNWPAPLRQREPAALADARQRLAPAISRQEFQQFIFFRQWQALRQYAHDHGLLIIGDIPIFVAFDSADVWVHPGLFHLDEEGKPTVVAGVPPDYFSPTGQLWGNPLYRWDVHAASGYAWWIERMRATFSLVDIVRLDHFRGFVGYWEVPFGNPTAEIGRWLPGPGAALFDALQAALGQGLPVIAEDLGVITPEVVALRERFGLPGMKILQFAFSGPENPFLPHHFMPNCVVYTGTHDNDTSLGWYLSAPQAERDFANQYLELNTPEVFPERLIRLAWSSTAVFALTTMQDLLGLGAQARMNYPGRLGGNWDWRMAEVDLDASLAARLAGLNRLYSR